MHYKSGVSSSNLALVPGTGQEAKRIAAKKKFSQENSRWPKGTLTDSSDENTKLIDSDEFKHLLEEISTPAPLAVECSPFSEEEESEVTRVQFETPSDDVMTGPVVSARGSGIQDAFTAPIAPAMRSALQQRMTAPTQSEVQDVMTAPITRGMSSAIAPAAPTAALRYEEKTMLARPTSIAAAARPAPQRPAPQRPAPQRAAAPQQAAAPQRAAAPQPVAAPAPQPVPLSYQQGDEHTAILTQDQREEWLDNNSDNTAILSGQQVAQWLSNPAPAPAPAPAASHAQFQLPPEARVEFTSLAAPHLAANALPQPAADLAEGTLAPESNATSDEELFALPHEAKGAAPEQVGSKLIANIFLGLFALVALVIGLAFALPVQRAMVQERVFPSAKPPVVRGVKHATPAVAPALAPGAKKLDSERMMSKAASAVTAGRRAEALEIYQELAAAYPSVPLYANLVHALKVSEATR